MEGQSFMLGCSSSSSSCCWKFNQFKLNTISSSLCNSSYWHPNKPKSWPKPQTHLFLSSGSDAVTSPLDFPLSVVLKQNEAALSFEHHNDDDQDSDSYSLSLPRIDKSGRFCSPRAARELALMIVYASCMEGSDPVRLFEKRLNAPRELYYQFDKSSLLKYDHMSYGGPPVTTATEEESYQLLSQFESESAIDAEVLSAPLKLVYSKLLLRFTRKLLSAVVDRWDDHAVIIDKVVPQNWKIEPAGRILEFCILHLAMSEISGPGTRHQIVINEAVDLAKRFCDGAAPRIINGCLRTFVQDIS